ncbi:MAG: DUF5683 domain-containing protein [Ignavibacteria bacterium]|jgi:hypothetical protein|nr:DUF5683 domain-containing protein [Ignavibacteria bacterium]
MQSNTIYKFLLAILFIVASITATAQTTDSITATPIAEKVDYVPLTKSTTGAMLRSLAFPGWGQLYVEHYWRSAVFAGAAGFLWYNIISNHINYKDYQSQLDNIADKNSNEYQIAKAKRNTAVDNRDLSGLYLIGVYALSIVDAYSGAHLFDFNVSDNVQLHIYPTINTLPYYNTGIGINIRY